MTEEGRPLLNIAFGCTGGRHRSVWAAETIGGWPQAQGQLIITHREIVPIFCLCRLPMWCQKGAVKLKVLIAVHI